MFESLRFIHGLSFAEEFNGIKTGRSIIMEPNAILYQYGNQLIVVSDLEDLVDNNDLILSKDYFKVSEGRIIVLEDEFMTDREKRFCGAWVKWQSENNPQLNCRWISNE